jgi:hypothetical protein
VIWWGTYESLVRGAGPGADAVGGSVSRITRSPWKIDALEIIGPFLLKEIA